MTAQSAYGVADLGHNMIQVQLVTMIVTGLHDEMVHHDVFATCPDTLVSSITVAGAAAHTQVLSVVPGRGERQEEALDIGRLSPPPTTWTVNPQIKTLEQLMKKRQSQRC